MKQTLRFLLAHRPQPGRYWLALLSCLLPLIAHAQQPTPQNFASYAAADQARFRVGAPVPAALAGLPSTGLRVLRPGVAVFGWLPAWVPASYVQQVDFALLSHVAYEGYQATEQGGLLAPATGDASKLAATVHQGNPRCRVLLSVGYQEPAGGGILFGAAAPAQQALVQAVAQQVSTLGADGVNLDLTFRPQAAGLPVPTHKASAGELKRNLKRLDKTRIRLNNQKPIIRQDSLLALQTQQAFDAMRQKGQPIPPKQLEEYNRSLKQQQKAAADFRRDLAAYRKALAAQKQGLLLPGTEPAADARPAALLSFVQALDQALRQKNPRVTLTLSLPAVDSARVYQNLPSLAPLVQVFVIKAFDYTVGQLGNPGPLAPLRPSSTGGANAVATSVGYYLGQGIPSAQLLVGLSSMGKVWSKYTNPPVALNAVAPYQYLSNRGLLARPRTSQVPDTASGSTLVQLGPDPDSAHSKHQQLPQMAWVDDSAGLAKKYAWMLSQQLGGVGIWALGFDAPNAPVWNLIRNRLAEPAPAVVPAAPAARADTARRVAWTPLAEAKAAESWLVMAPLAHVLLFGLALLLGCAWLGLVLGAALAVRHWVPFPRRLALVSGLVLSGATLLALYGCLIGHFSTTSLVVGWVTALALLGLGLLSYHTARPRQLP